MHDLVEVLGSGRKLLVEILSDVTEAYCETNSTMNLDSESLFLCQNRKTIILNMVREKFGLDFGRHNISEDQMMRFVEFTSVSPRVEVMQRTDGLWRKNYTNLALGEVIPESYMMQIHLNFPDLRCFRTPVGLSTEKWVLKFFGLLSLRFHLKFQKIYEAGLWGLHTGLVNHIHQQYMSRAILSKERNGEPLNPFLDLRTTVKPLSTTGSQIVMPFYLLFGMLGSLCFTVFIIEFMVATDILLLIKAIFTRYFRRIFFQAKQY
jgi:hypothetical protein